MKYFAFAILCVVVVACDDKAKPPPIVNVQGACGETSPPSCGGNITGTWTVNKACGQILSISICSDISVDTSQFEVSGTDTFNADGTYSRALTMHGPVTAVLGPNCQFGQTCTVLGTYIGPLFAAYGANVSVACTGATSGCTCTGTLSWPQTLTGTYTMPSTGVVEITIPTDAGDAGPAVSDYNYCVTGNTLSLQTGSVSDAGSDLGVVFYTLN
jgi:hypothetical protein